MDRWLIRTDGRYGQMVNMDRLSIWTIGRWTFGRYAYIVDKAKNRPSVFASITQTIEKNHFPKYFLRESTEDEKVFRKLCLEIQTFLFLSTLGLLHL